MLWEEKHSIALRVYSLAVFAATRLVKGESPTTATGLPMPFYGNPPALASVDPVVIVRVRALRAEAYLWAFREVRLFLISFHR